MVAENVDFFLEDLEDLSDRSDIKEKVDWSHQDMAERIIYDAVAHMTLMLLDKIVA